MPPTIAEAAQAQVYTYLKHHFDNTSGFISMEDVASGTGLDESVTQNALRVLHKMGRIEGVMTWGADYPRSVTGVRYF